MSEVTTIYDSYIKPLRFTIDTRKPKARSYLNNTNSNQYKLNLANNVDYDFIVDWGDGKKDRITQYDQEEITHTYDIEGVYEITMSGKIGQILWSSVDSSKLLKIFDFGNSKITTSSRPFGICNNFTLHTKTPPIFKDDFKSMTGQWFRDCSSIAGDFSLFGTADEPLYGNTSGFMQEQGLQITAATDVNVNFVYNATGNFNTNFFSHAFNGDLDNWNTSQVTAIDRCFGFGFNNDSIKNWDVGKVNRMDYMFYRTPFNQDISIWNTSGVTNMGHMFAETPFNQPIGTWDVSNVTNFSGMFRMYRLHTFPMFNNGGSPSISGWTLSADPNVNINMSTMFYENLDFNQPIGSWNTERVTNMSNMFYNRFSFNLDISFDQDLSNWDVSNVTNFSGTFFGLHSMSNENCNKLSNWQVTSACTDTSAMIRGMGTDKFTNVNFSHWDMRNVTNIYSMFAGTGIGKDTNGVIGISNWNTSNMTNIGQLFLVTPYFNENISGWDVSNVTQMKEVFYQANTFDQDLSDWVISGVTLMSNMFLSSGMSTENYSNTLIGWANQASNIQSNVPLGAGTIKYNSSAVDAHDLLTGTYGWTITDGGLEN